MPVVHTPIVCTACVHLRDEGLPEFRIREDHNANVSKKHQLPVLQSGIVSDKVQG